MESDDKDRENFFRICILVVDYIKNALVNMLKYYLLQNNMSFEKFIDEHMTDIRYLRSKKILYQEEVDKLIVDGKAISGITVDDLEVTLVRRLLDNLCPDLFMDDDSRTLQGFLEKNQHNIYHLVKFNERCCQCSQDYKSKYPITEKLLEEDQYKKMFTSSSPCTNCAGTSGTVCSVASCIVNTDYIHFDYKIKCIVLGYFSPISKVLQKLTNIRNEAYGHRNETMIPNVLYDAYKKDIEENIMVLAKICGNEDETRLALDDVQKRLYDGKLCSQYLISLTEQVQRDNELMEAIGENRQILQENNQILQKIPQQLQEITEEVRNLQTTKTNLPKDIQAGVMTSCSPESSSNNISTGNDQRGQGYQSSIDTDAEPYIKNDLENKTDNFDGVVLHAEEDRDAAKEFITNMERENPDLNINITIYENIQPGTSVFESPAKLFDSYRYLFVFVTENFVKAELEKTLSQIATIETLIFQDRNARLIPVKTDQTYHSALAHLKSLRYDNYLEAKESQQGPDKPFIKCFRDLITHGRLNYLLN